MASRLVGALVIVGKAILAMLSVSAAVLGCTFGVQLVFRGTELSLPDNYASSSSKTMMWGLGMILLGIFVLHLGLAFVAFLRVIGGKALGGLWVALQALVLVSTVAYAFYYIYVGIGPPVVEAAQDNRPGIFGLFRGVIILLWSFFLGTMGLQNAVNYGLAEVSSRFAVKQSRREPWWLSSSRKLIESARNGNVLPRTGEERNHVCRLRCGGIGNPLPLETKYI
jgi:hypothetical protein